MRRLTLVLWTLALCALMMPVVSVAHATTMQRLDVPELTKRSELVVRAQVSKVSTELVRGKVFTTISLRVEETLKGQPQKDVTLRLIGGRHGDLVTLVHGQPHFKSDEHVLVFLERSRPDRPFVVTGMSQGKFRITKDADGSTLWANPQLGDVRLVDPQPLTPAPGEGSLKPVAPSEAHRAPIKLDALQQQVRDAARNEVTP